MRALLIPSIALALVAGSASAQVLSGQVGGQVGVGAPMGQVGSTVRGAGDLTRDTVRDTRGAIRDSRPDLRANAGADVRTDTRVSRSQVDISAALRTGADVRASDGEFIGRVVDVTRNASGRATSFVLRSVDGSTRTLLT